MQSGPKLFSSSIYIYIYICLWTYISVMNGMKSNYKKDKDSLENQIDIFPKWNSVVKTNLLWKTNSYGIK